MNTVINTITDEINERLYFARQVEKPLERITGIVKVLEEGVSQLKHFVKTNGFQSQEDEIEYFKFINPAILALLIEEGIKYSIAVNMPITTTVQQIRYYEDQVTSFQSFFQINAFHYQYYRNHLNEMDKLYFLRNSAHLALPLTDNPEADRKYTTLMSSLFARFIAYEHLQYYLLEQIALLRHPALGQLPKNMDAAAEIRWTGDAVNIIELTYGIYLTGQLNNGNVSLNQVVRWIEKNLHVTIGNIQSRFAEISARKRVGPTKYIDQMKKNILQKLQDDNE